MSVKVAVVIPVYKENLNEFEKISLTQVQKILDKYQIIFVAPEGLKADYFIPNSKIYYFPQQFFQNVNTYSALLTSPLFYQAFLEYDYILLYQLDAFVFYDKLEYFCSLGYDYIGAPWPSIWARKIGYKDKIYKARVGNGGFSLRNVKTSLKVLDESNDLTKKLLGIPEDDFWSFMGIIEGSGFKSAPLKIADEFSVEYFPERTVKKNGGKIPFGCHGWYRFDADSYIKFFASSGYNINYLREKMQSIFSLSLPNSLTNYSWQRLIRRLQRGQSVVRYLSKKHYASIRVVRNPLSMLLLARLLMENNNLSNEVFFYNEDENDILIQDLKLERMPHLLITAGRGYDVLLLDELIKRGITYGNRIVSFYQEYINYCKEVFKNLGK